VESTVQGKRPATEEEPAQADAVNPDASLIQHMLDPEGAI